MLHAVLSVYKRKAAKLAGTEKGKRDTADWFVTSK
jgi:hypothetical protein